MASTALLDAAAQPNTVCMLPLCVDLDGTLLKTDTLIEGVLAVLVSPKLYRKLPCLFVPTRSRLKARVSEAAPLDVARLPYDVGLLAYLQEQKALGRVLVLATAAHWRVAQAVAAHVGLFDEVIASDDHLNLKGSAKAEALLRRFPNGFVYAGDSKADLAVWAKASGAIVIGGSATFRDEVRRMAPIETEVPRTGNRARAMLRAMRPHQWVKNGLVFVPIATAHAEYDGASWVGGVVACVAFCCVASGIYLLNDLADLSADRQHTRKRHRPFASGALPLMDGVAMAAVLLVVGFGFAASFSIMPFLLLYAAMSIAYSLRLKELPLVDVFMLAGLYTIRLVTGGIATGHPLTLWLFNVSTFLFLGLAILKRVGELMAASGSPSQMIARRGYSPSDLMVLQMLGTGAAFASSVMLALFVQSESERTTYGSPYVLWGLVPLMLFWQCRLWLATMRGHMHDDPIVFAARDRVSWCVGIVLILLLLAAKTRLQF